MTTSWPRAASALPRPATCAACSPAYGSAAVAQADTCRATRAIFIPGASLRCPGCRREIPDQEAVERLRAGLVRAGVLKRKGTPNQRHAVTDGVCLRRKHYVKRTPMRP